MSEWKSFCLGDVVKIKYGKNQKRVQSDSGQFPIYGTGGLIGYAEKFLYDKPSVLIGRKGSISKVKFVDRPFWTVDTLFYTEINESLAIPKFFYYSLSLIDLSHYNEGTTIPSLRTETLNKLEVLLPPLETQKKIAAVLSALDDKIELNNAINKNLEEQAQAIYKHMFVDNFNPAWQRGTLSDISEITMGQSPSGKSYNENGIGTIFFQGRTDFGFRFPTTRMFTTEPKRIASKNDIMFSVRAPVGDYNIALENCCIGRGLAALSAKNNYQSFLFYTLPHLKQQLEIYNGQGTVFGAINQQELKKIKVDIPEQNLINKFEKIVNPMDEIILNNHLEDQKLAEIRDALLPRLMSGEIDVSAVEI